MCRDASIRDVSLMAQGDVEYMPKGPNGEKRPADANARAVHIAKIATGEIEDDRYETPNRRKSGMAGAKARLDGLSSERRQQIAKEGAKARWNNERRRAMTNTNTACEALAERYDAKRKQGLKDVKFLLQNREEASFAEACDDLLAFDKAIDDKKTKVSDFGDLKLKN